jgi:hypothetical protein
VNQKTDRSVPRPRPSTCPRDDAARQWLAALHIPATTARVAALAPFMGVLRRGEPRWFALRTALIRGLEPSDKAIDEQVERWHRLLADYGEHRWPGTRVPGAVWATMALTPTKHDRHGTPLLVGPLLALIVLDQGGKDCSPQAIAALEPYLVSPFDIERFRALTAIVRHGGLPTRRAITDHVDQHRKRLETAYDKHHQRVHDLTGGAPEHVAAFVADFIEAHGHGPSWTEVRREFGWTRCQAPLVLHTLQLRGWLDWTPAEPGSLRPGRLHAAMTSRNAGGGTQPPRPAMTRSRS